MWKKLDHVYLVGVPVSWCPAKQTIRLSQGAVRRWESNEEQGSGLVDNRALRLHGKLPERAGRFRYRIPWSLDRLVYRVRVT